MKPKYLTSKLLDGYGIKHGFFTREGGVSPNPFDSLNFGLHGGDKRSNIEQNQKLALSAINILPKNFIFLRGLDHGTEVLQVDKNAGSEVRLTGDAIITEQTGLALGLCIADCAPIIMADKQKRLIGIIHAGWRGLAAGIIDNAIGKIRKAGIKPNELVVAIGPSIGPESFEFGPEAKDIFPKRYISRRGSSQYVDLWKLMADQLKANGVKTYENLRIDSYQNTDKFFSYRKEGKTGRFLSVVEL